MRYLQSALFLHIQKTAGTSIQEMARGLYGNENVISHGDYLTLKHDECTAVPFISGHFSYEFARPLMGGRYSFTFLRDPVDRLISLYTFCAAQCPSLHPLYAAANGRKLHDFLKLVEKSAVSNQIPLRSWLWNHQMWQLAYGHAAASRFEPDVSCDDFSPGTLLEMAKHNLKKFDYVGFVETFDQDAISIFRALGSTEPRPQKSNVGREKPLVAKLSTETKALLESCTELDRELYNYAWERRVADSNYRKDTTDF